MTVNKKSGRLRVLAGILTAAAVMAGCAGVPQTPEPAPEPEPAPAEESTPEIIGVIRDDIDYEAAAAADSQLDLDQIGLTEEEFYAIADTRKDFRGEGTKEPADLAALQQENEDVKATLGIPGVLEAVPLVQKAGDAEYYKTHDFSGEESEFGSVYIDIGNDCEFMDPNTVMHVSAELVESPYSDFLGYGDRIFFEENPYIYITLPDCVLEYQVFASYEDITESILKIHNCYDYLGYVAYTDNMFARTGMDSLTDESLTQTVRDAWNIITLQVDEGSDLCRYVHAVLTGKELR